jgi:hypothetical protein
MPRQLRLVLGGLAALCLMELACACLSYNHLRRENRSAARCHRHSDYLDALKPSPQGVSFVLPPPVSRGFTIQERSFGWGSWFWLQSAVAQTPGCERTPPTNELDVAAGYLHIKDWEVPAAKEKQLASLMDATFVATGRLSKASGVYKLEYQLWDSSGKQLGNPIAATGTQDQVVAQLPSIRSKLLAHAKIADIPTSLPLLQGSRDAAIL